jgi:hypothetical protein
MAFHWKSKSAFALTVPQRDFLSFCIHEIIERKNAAVIGLVIHSQALAAKTIPHDLCKLLNLAKL